jgi:hypothetical protein
MFGCRPLRTTNRTMVIAMTEREPLPTGARTLRGRLRKPSVTTAIRQAQKAGCKVAGATVRIDGSVSLADDPTRDIRIARPPKSEGHKTWGEPEIAAFRAKHPLGAGTTGI